MRGRVLAGESAYGPVHSRVHEGVGRRLAARWVRGDAGARGRREGIGRACGTRKEGLREGVGLLRELRIGGSAGRGAPVVRDGAQHALRQRGELSGFGTAIRIDVSATKLSQAISAVTPDSGGVALVPSKNADEVVPFFATVGANVGRGGGCGYCMKTRLSESRPPYPTQRDDDLAVDTNCFAAFAFGNARMLSLTTMRPSVVPRSTPFPDGGPLANAASTSAAFEHACFNASV